MDSFLTQQQQKILRAISCRDLRSQRNEDRPHAIGPISARFLYLQALASRPDVVVELGTGHGYSTIYLSAAAKSLGITVITVDSNRTRQSMARRALEAGHSSDNVTFINSEACHYLRQAKFPEESRLLVLLDTDKFSYKAILEALIRHVTNETIIISDNVLSHRSVLGDYYSELDKTTDSYLTLPIGKGLDLIFLPKRPPIAL